MIAAYDGCGYAQAGFTNLWVGGVVKIRHKAEVARSCTDYTSAYGADIGAGERHTYRTLYYPGCTCELSTVDGVELQRSNFSPYGTWAYPFIAQFFGEVKYFETDMPGKGSVHTNFTGLGAEQASNHTVVAMPCTMVGRIDSASWGLVGNTCNNFDLWTK